MKNELELILAALIWGCAFVAQSVGMEYIGPWTFNCMRFLIGGATLSVLMPLLDKVRGGRPRFDNPKMLYLGGAACGCALAAASLAQQTGIIGSTVGKAGFISALYVVIVPFFSLLMGKKVPWKIIFCALLACAGLYLLSMSGSASLTLSDLYLLAGAALFAVHILVIDHFAPLCDGIRMSSLQFYTAGLLSLPGMLFLEHPQLSQIIDAALPVLYAGVLSCGAAYTLQIVGQIGADPSMAGILLSLESVFSVLAGWVILHQTLSLRELAGCALMFAAILLVQKLQ